MYIGMSIKDDITSKKSRPYKHLHGKGSKVVYASVQKYGIENFLVLILHREDCDKEKLKKLEKYYIKHFSTFGKNGYNLTGGGDGGNTLKGMSQKKLSLYKENLSKIQKISMNRPEVKEKISASGKIAQNVPETKNKIAKTRTNKSEKEKLAYQEKQKESQLIAQNRPEVKKKISDAMMGNKNNSLGLHNRWHFNRGILNSDCEHCIKQVMKEHS
jgi:hypothetical protein